MGALHVVLATPLLCPSSSYLSMPSSLCFLWQPPFGEPSPVVTVISLSLTRPPSLSLQLLPSFSISLSLLLSLLLSSMEAKGDPSIWQLVNKHALEELGQRMPKQLGPAQLVAKRCCWRLQTTRGRPRRNSGETPFSDHSHRQFIVLTSSLNSLLKTVPSVSEKCARIIGMYFHTKTKTLQVDSSQTEPYFEVTILNSYS